jgi:transcriptional regulator with XRE-family HTH domain
MKQDVSTKEDLTLKSLIEDAGYTQRDFAKTLGLALSTVTFYISGEKLPRIDRFFEMCKTLGVSPKTLAQSMGLDVSDVPDDISSKPKKRSRRDPLRGARFS